MSDFLRDSLCGLEKTLKDKGVDEEVTSLVNLAIEDTSNHSSTPDVRMRNQNRELRFRLKRDVILEVRSLFNAIPGLEQTCNTLKEMPASKVVFDTKCDLLYRLAEVHPNIRSIFAHYSDLSMALRREVYVVHPEETDHSDLKQ